MERIPNWLAYVLPMGLFLVLTSCEATAAITPYYPLAYTVKIVLVAGTWWVFRHRYPPVAAKGLGLGAAAGVAGVFLWVGLASLQLETAVASYLPTWLRPGERVGFDPFSIENPAGRWAFLFLRLAGLAVVVPLMEEVFWRGFLIRYLVEPEFEKVPWGKVTRLAFVATTLLFAAVHPEFVAALAWGTMINFVYVRTANLWACVETHAVTNLLLGIYVLATGSWWLW